MMSLAFLNSSTLRKTVGFDVTVEYRDGQSWSRRNGNHHWLITEGTISTGKGWLEHLTADPEVKGSNPLHVLYIALDKWFSFNDKLIIRSSLSFPWLDTYINSTLRCPIEVPSPMDLQCCYVTLYITPLGHLLLQLS